MSGSEGCRGVSHEKALRICFESIGWKPSVSAGCNHRLGDTPVPRAKRIVGIGRAGNLGHDLTLVALSLAQFVIRVFLQARAMQVKMSLWLETVDGFEKGAYLWSAVENAKFEILQIPVR